MGSPRQYYRFRWVLRGCGMILVAAITLVQLRLAWQTWGMAEAPEHLLVGLLGVVALVVAGRYGYLRRVAPADSSQDGSQAAE